MITSFFDCERTTQHDVRAGGYTFFDKNIQPSTQTKNSSREVREEF